MEERMIDDEYGRGVKMKKTKDGFVDVTDAEVEDTEELEEGGEEALFEFPAFDEDDEELAMLTPEEAMQLKKRREEEEAARLLEYQTLCQTGEADIEAGDFQAAEAKFEKALWLQDDATDAAVGYWRAKTADFSNPDVLAEEYVSDVDSMESDVGKEAMTILRERYQGVFRARLAALEAEEKPLAEGIEAKQISRRGIIKTRVRRTGIATLIAALPALACLILAIVYGLKIPTVKDDRYILPAIVLAAGFLVCFLVFIVVTNKWINALRIHRANESLSSSDEGVRLLEIREYKEVYQALLVDDTDKK